MILLIWDQCWVRSLEEISAYEFEEGSSEAELAKFCDGKRINARNDDMTDAKLEDLYNIAQVTTNRLNSPGPFGPYSAIYISGFIP